MIRTTLAAAALLAAAQPAFAGEQKCYRRVYDAAHMASQPKQSVTTLEVIFDDEIWNDLVAVVTVVFRGSPNVYGNTLGCYPGQQGDPDGAVRCSVDCDGGTFLAWPSGGDAILLKTDGFIVEGGCGEEGEPRFVRDDTDGPTTFKLYEVDAATCSLQNQ